MTDTLQSELEYLKSNVPDVPLESKVKFGDEINAETFAKLYGKEPEIVLEQEPEITTQHIGMSEANKDIIEMYKNNELDALFGTELDNGDYISALKTLAERENANAQNILGICYFMGVDCEINKQLSIELFERANEQEHIIAKRNLAIALENVDPKHSIDLYKQAEKLGDKVAQINLENMKERQNQKKSLDSVLSLKDKTVDTEQHERVKENKER